MARTSAISCSVSLVLLAALSQGACTVSDPPRIGTSLFALGPQIPGPSPTQPKMPMPQPKPLKCAAKPDLGVESVEVTASVANWAYVCAKIANKGGAAWTSNASQLSVELTDVDSGNVGSASGISSLAVDASTQRCAWVRAPGLIRHGAPTGTECGHKRKFTGKLLFDPDIATDANTSNDDCNKLNNSRVSEVPYVVTCLI